MSNWNPPPPLDLSSLNGRVVSVSAWKGGVGKTTVGAELAYLLGAVLVDADWDQGGASRALGYVHEKHKTAPLLDAMQAGKVPRLWDQPRRASLVPSHPDLEENQPTPEAFSGELEKWAAHYGRPLLVDTHPGGCPLTYGAIAASSVVVVPAVLGVKELEALDGMCRELRDFPLLIIPHMVKPVPQAWAVDKMKAISKTYGVPIGPVISHYGWLQNRRFRMAICGNDPIPARAERYVEQLHQVAEAVITYVSSK